MKIHSETSDVLTLESLVSFLETGESLSKGKKKLVESTIKLAQIEGVSDLKLREKVCEMLGKKKSHLPSFLKPLSDTISSYANKNKFGVGIPKEEIAKSLLQDSRLKSTLIEKKEKALASLEKLDVSPADRALVEEAFKSDSGWEVNLIGQSITCGEVRLQYDAFSQDIILIKGNKWLYLDSEKIMYSPDESLPFLDVYKLHAYIKENRDSEEMREDLSLIPAVYYPTRETNLARSIHFTDEGKVYIHLNKKTPSPYKPDGDEVLGIGAFKMVTIAIDIDTGERFASASMSAEEAEREIESLKPFEGIEGFPQIASVVRYRSLKSGVIKVRLLYPIADRGNLFDLIERNELTKEEKTIVFESILRTAAIMHEKGILHRDLKPQNILISGRGKEIKIHIIDFGGSTPIDDDKEKREFSGSTRYMSPEYIQNYSYVEQLRDGYFEELDDYYALKEIAGDEISKVTTEANDIWALGTLLDELLHGGERAFAPNAERKSGWNRQIREVLARKNIENYVGKDEPLDKSSKEHLIWSMLRKDPTKRPSAKELVERL